jgi:signal transduction histidine kinase
MQNLLSRLKKLPITAVDAFKRDTAAFSSRHVYFGLVAFFGFPLYFVVWHDLFPQPYENLPLRLTGAVVFMPIVLAKFWPEKLKRYFALYWYLALVFALPFFFTFMLLKNEGSTAWLLSTIVALFVMILLLDPINLLVHLVVGVSAATLAFDLTASHAAAVHIATLEFIPIFLFAIAMGIIVSYTGEKLRTERQHAMLATAGMVAHELRTPLLSIKTGATGARQHLPMLLDAYQLAVERHLVRPSIRASHLESMGGVLDRIEAEADRSNTVIDMLLYTLRGIRVDKKDFRVCSMMECVQTALRRFPFVSGKDRNLVTRVGGEDFSFSGTEILMVHVLFNLLKNSIRHIAVAGKGTITIEMESEGRERRLLFRDTGPGIPPEVLPHIFTPYYAWPTPGHGVGETTGVGLAFCRDVVKAFGGTINCRSRLNKYTEFVIAFPGGVT